MKTYVFNFRMSGDILEPSIKDVVVESEIIEIPAETEETIAAEETIPAVEETTPAAEETLATEECAEVPQETVIHEDPAIAEEAAASETTAVPEENATEPTTVEEETIPGNASEASDFAADETVESSKTQDEAVLETVAPEEVTVTEPASEEIVVMSAPKPQVTAEIESIDVEEIKAQAEYPEMVVEKIGSRLSYGGVYEDTDVIFDLNSNQVKESIVLKEYRDSLKGYAYTLEVGALTPVLLETGEIELQDADGEDIVMYMPAPYLIDAAGTTCFDVNVSLEGENGQ